MATSTESLGPTTLLNSARTSMSSKIVGAEGDFFAKMVVDAMNAVKWVAHLGDSTQQGFSWDQSCRGGELPNGERDSGQESDGRL